MSFWTQFRDTVLQKTGITKKLPQQLGGRTAAAINNLQSPAPTPVINTSYNPNAPLNSAGQGMSQNNTTGTIYVVLGGVAAALLLYKL